jgi:hypothetical protein
MANLWDDVKNAIVDGYVYAADKAEELTQISRAKVEILRLNRQIARTMSEIGGRVFDMFERDDQEELAGDSDVIAAVETIQRLRVEIRSWEKEIEQAKAERDKQASAE